MSAELALSLCNRLMGNNRFQLLKALTNYSRVLKVEHPKRTFTTTNVLFCEENKGANKQIDPSKDRSKVIPVETSIKYLQSSAYKTTYGSDPVWKHYRRNHKGAIPPRKTRKMCIRGNVISTGNPCPVCRDEYLVLDPRNVELLKQFISPHNGEILSFSLTGVCQKRHQELLLAIHKAKDMGLITYDVPFREYNYAEYIESN